MRKYGEITGQVVGILQSLLRKSGAEWDLARVPL
jgi:hypothetical protein